MYRFCINITIHLGVIKKFMSKTAQLNIRADLEVKKNVERIFKRLGLTHSEAINIFYNQVILNEGLPFEIKIPKTFNDDTIQAINDVNNNVDTVIYDKIEDAFEALGI